MILSYLLINSPNYSGGYMYIITYTGIKHKYIMMLQHCTEESPRHSLSEGCKCQVFNVFYFAPLYFTQLLLSAAAVMMVAMVPDDNAKCDGYSGDSCTSFECECKRGFEEIDITTDGQATTVCIGMK